VPVAYQGLQRAFQDCRKIGFVGDDSERGAKESLLSEVFGTLPPSLFVSSVKVSRSMEANIPDGTSSMV